MPMETTIDGRFDLNLVVIGKSGAGKSSFCNYLFDRPDHFATGKGKPVTGWEDNFANYRFERGAFSFNVFDSVGLEADNLPEWNGRFEAFLGERRSLPLFGPSIEPSQWIHGFFYVLNASSGRIEPAEIELIRKAANYGAPIMLVLTNCDAASDKVAPLREAIGKDLPGVSINEVCSVEIRRRTGATVRFGREEVLRDYIEQSRATLAFNLARFTCRKLVTALRAAKSEAVARIEASDISIRNLSEIDLDEVLDLSTLDEHFESVDFFREYLHEFGFDDHAERDFHQEIRDALEESVENGSQAMERRFDSVGDDLENGGFFKKIVAVYEVGKTALMLKSTLAKVVGDLFDDGMKAMNLLDRLFEEQSRALRPQAEHVVAAIEPAGWPFPLIPFKQP